MKKTLQLYETDYNYKVFERERKFIKTNNEIIKGETVIAVKLERKQDGAYVIDPLTNSFLYHEFWLNDICLNTQKTYIKVVCSFLNYCRYMTIREEPEFVDLYEGVFNLKFHHACLFLKEQVERFHSGNLKPETVVNMELPLLLFYQHLINTDIVQENVEELVKKDERDKNKIVYNPFRQLGKYKVSLPKLERSFQTVRDFSEDNLEERLANIHLMINLARSYYPDIAFALCIMFYGGLRLGEVVNLTRNSLEKPIFSDDDIGTSGFVLNVKDNPELFKNIKTKSNNEVKRKEKFVSIEMIDIDLVSEIYKNHKLRIVRLEKLNKIKNKDALFYSSSKGTPLTYNTAYYQFKRLSEIFIDTLVENGDKKTLDSLTDMETRELKINPHLTRAIFTNLGIDLGYTKEQLQIRRGDRSINSQEAYWNRKMVKLKRQEIVSTVQAEAVDSYIERKEK